MQFPWRQFVLHAAVRNSVYLFTFQANLSTVASFLNFLGWRLFPPFLNGFVIFFAILAVR